jgi:hypothetical protein
MSYHCSYLEVAKQGCLEPDRLFDQNKLVSKDLLVTELDLDIRNRLVAEEGTTLAA